MIPISEVLEEAARECDKLYDDLLQSPGEFSDGQRVAALQIADEIRALAAKYENCIVAEGEPVGHACRAGGGWVDCSIKPAPLPADGSHLQLYLAKEKAS
jgi:hypothetical protein